MQFLCVASGSKGNCYYVDDGRDAVLIDCGISAKRLETALAGFGGTPERLRGIFVTHEHRDHISGVGVLLRRYHLPLWGSAATLRAMDERIIGRVDEDLFHALPYEGADVGDFHIHATGVSHDAADPVSYEVHWHGRKLSMLTDSGFASDANLSALSDSDLIVVEANHDPDLLRDGPYPAALKRRIHGDRGHLSNADCGRALNEIMSGRTRHVILAHLSETNNNPQLAYHTVRTCLDKAGGLPDSTHLWVASQREPLALRIDE